MKRIKLDIGLFIFAALFFFGRAGLRTDAAGKYTIYVNRKTNIVNVVNRKGQLVRSMYCSTGRKNSTIRGTFYTKNKMRWHALYHGVYGQYCTRIHGAYLFHSVPYSRPAKSKVLIKEYNRLGTQASDGCVRLAVVDAKWIYNNCKSGTKVVIGESGKLIKPARRLVKLSTASKKGWDPTDPDTSNPYYPRITFRTNASKKIAYGSDFDPLERITVSSKITNKKTLMEHVSVTGKVNVNKPGKYKITYTVKDPATLLSKSLKATYTVGKKPAKEPAEEKTESTQSTDTSNQ